MSKCHPLPTPFPAKADDVITALAEPILNPDPKIIKEFQELCGALLYVQVHTVPEISWALLLRTKYMTKAGPVHLATAENSLSARTEINSNHMVCSSVPRATSTQP